MGWVLKDKAGKQVKVVAPGTQTARELQKENSQLRKELVAVKMERDILKKATAYFAKESLQGTPS